MLGFGGMQVWHQSHESPPLNPTYPSEQAFSGYPANRGRKPLQAEARHALIDSAPTPGYAAMSGFGFEKRVAEMKSKKVLICGWYLLALLVAFRTPQAASAAGTKLNVPFPANACLGGWGISPNSQWVVYSVKDSATNLVIALYSVPVSGGAAVQITPALAAGGSVGAYQFSPDSSQVIFLIAQPGQGFELYSLPTGGGAAVKLSLTNPAAGDQVYTFQISPDSSKVVYQALTSTTNYWELYNVPIVGPAGSSLLLTMNPNAGHVDSGFRISPDSSRVVYRAGCEYPPNAGQSCANLYSTSLSGGLNIQLNSPLQWGGGMYSGITFSPDSQWVVYRSYGEGINSGGGLYSTPITGPIQSVPVVQLSRLLEGNPLDWLINPDGSRVVFRGEQETMGVVDLFSVPLRGPKESGVRLNETLATGGSITNAYQVTPVNARVIYLAIKQGSSVTQELYSVPLAGPSSAGVRLNQAISDPALSVPSFGFSPDGQRIVFAQYLTAGRRSAGFFSVPAAGPASQQVQVGNSGPETNNGVSPLFYVSNTGVFFSQTGGPLLSNSITSPIAASFRLDGPPTHSVGYFSLAPDGSSIVYAAATWLGSSWSGSDLYSIKVVIPTWLVFVPRVPK